MAVRRGTAQMLPFLGYMRSLETIHSAASTSRAFLPTQIYSSKLVWRAFSSLPPHQKLAMPALSPTMTQGNIAKWHVKPGDEIAPGTVLADIETDKATLAFENQDDGYIAALLHPDGAKDIPVGEPVAIIVEEADDVAAFANYSNSAPVAAAATAPAAHAAQPSGATSFPDYTPLKMPALSPTMEQGNIISWAVKEGDEVVPGTILAEIETDKATLAFENQDEGYVAKIVAPAGSKDVQVGQLVAILVEDADQIPAFANFTAGTGSSSDVSQPQPRQPTAAPADSRQQPVQANFRLGPAARKALQEAGLTVSDVAPTGPNNIITKADVLAAAQSGVKSSAAAAAAPPAAAAKHTPAPTAKATTASPAAPGDGATHQDIPNTQVRSIIAKRLLESKLTAPSLYVSLDVELEELTRLRKSMTQQGKKVSVNDFVMRAAALALRDTPQANAFWDPSSSVAVQQPSVDVCVAVATDGGLITPIVKAADTKSITQISAEVKDLAARARANKLKPEEFMGGTFSISNLGMFGLSSFSAIINPPQAAILAVGGSQQQVVMDSEGGLRSVSTMTVTLSADHRVFDGELATQLLGSFKAYMENPVAMAM